MASWINILPPHFSLVHATPSDGGAFYVSKKVLSVIIYLRCTRLSQGAIYQLLWIMKSPVIRYTRPPSEDVPSGSTPPCT